VGCGFFLQSAAGVFWTIPARLFSAEMAGGARGVINALGNLGGFCGPYAVGVLITLYSKDAGFTAWRFLWRWHRCWPCCYRRNAMPARKRIPR
jgi:nitrate/nitrite transporter NarK